VDDAGAVRGVEGHRHRLADVHDELHIEGAFLVESLA
jgi:hypothetical protein